MGRTQDGPPVLLPRVPILGLGLFYAKNVENTRNFQAGQASFLPKELPAAGDFGHSAEFSKPGRKAEKKSPEGGFYTCIPSAFLL